MAVIGIFQQLGVPEILIILFVALLLFGAKRLPEIGRSLGKGIREFKGGVKGLGEDVKEGLEPDDKRAAPPPTKDPGDGV